MVYIVTLGHIVIFKLMYSFTSARTTIDFERARQDEICSRIPFPPSLKSCYMEVISVKLYLNGVFFGARSEESINRNKIISGSLFEMVCDSKGLLLRILRNS